MIWRKLAVHLGGRGRWIAMYLAAGFLFLLAVRIFVVIGTRTTSDAIYLATGLVVLWYTIETWRLRREAQLQNELQTRPFLSLTIEGQGFERRARLVNVGRGVAKAIGVKSIVVSPSLELRDHRGVTHLVPGAGALLPLRMWLRETADDAFAEIPFKDQDWNIAKLLDNEAVTVVASYASLTDQWYETTIQMAEGAPRTPQIVADERRPRPKMSK
jgi:hypothetical protein